MTPQPLSTKAAAAATLLVTPSKSSLPKVLHGPIIESVLSSLSSSDHSGFTIALSGGSLPSFLSTLPEAFTAANVDPQYDRWHVLLADERCVPHHDDDSNYKSLKQHLLDRTSIPSNQIHPLDETMLDQSPDEIAKSYEANCLLPCLSESGGKIDLALLGFGLDGHTCSLFPSHPLLNEMDKTVAGIFDSPKPPPKRITLTLPTLNDARKVVFVGVGNSKGPILEKAFKSIVRRGDAEGGGKKFDVELTDPPPYPCAMVRPKGEESLFWIVDEDAMKDVPVKSE